MDAAVARTVAERAHAGQRTRFGDAFIEHLDRVAAAVPLEACAAALLHDVLEHSETPLDELRSQGLGPRELAVLHLLTRAPGESFESHALRVAHAPGPTGVIARAVRRADLEDHLAHRPMPWDAPPYRWALRHIVTAQARYRDRPLRAIAS